VETAGISYRVADFLKNYPPFNAVADADLLALTAHGRVKFHEPNEYLLWKGEPHRPFLLVIQQGTVSLWDEAADSAELRDVRGPGDMLGLERYNGAKSCLYSARAESDVVVYAFPDYDFEAWILKYPHAAQYVAAEGEVSADYHPASGRREPRRIYLDEVMRSGPRPTASAESSIADVAKALLRSRTDAMAVVDAQHRAHAIVTPDRLLEWIARGAGDARQSIESLLGAPPPAVAPRASVSDSVLLMSAAHVDALALTDDGTPSGRLQTVVTPRDLGPAFGDRPLDLLRDISRAASIEELRGLNHRCRAFVLDQLTSAGAVDWLSTFANRIDAAIVGRAIALGDGGSIRGCWCFAGSSGRAESLTRLVPHLLLIAEDDAVAPGDRAESGTSGAYLRVLDALGACDYLPRLQLPFPPAFYVASASEWKRRYQGWISDPVGQHMHRVRSLFDLRPVHGVRALCDGLETAIDAIIDIGFVQVLANDCLASLPPLTFFQDAVVDTAGEQSAVFRLEHSAVRPLVDAARVFGMAARRMFSASTLERFAVARTILPEHEAIFREASETFRIVLWQQGRVGITQGTDGADLPPALLSRHDRHVLKSGFRSIQRVLELTADRGWVAQL
jgi:CBS domain-containing protein